MNTGDLEYLMCSLPELSFDLEGHNRKAVESLLSSYSGILAGDSRAVQSLNLEAAKFLPDHKSKLFTELELENLHEERFRISPLKILSDFANFRYEMRNAILTYRRSLKNPPLKGTEPVHLPDLDGNPLENEIRLLRFQWNRLEDMAHGQHSGFGALLIYRFRLLLLNRLWSFQARRGFRNYLEFVNQPEV